MAPEKCPDRGPCWVSTRAWNTARNGRCQGRECGCWRFYTHIVAPLCLGNQPVKVCVCLCVCVCLSAWQLELPFWFANFSISHFPFESTKSTKCNTANASLVSFRSCILIIYFGKLFISRFSICPQPPHLISLSCQTIRHSPTLSTYCLAINADLYYFP